MDKYDLSGGYVGAIGNLLLSEAKVGYTDASGRLVVVDISDTPTSGANSLSKRHH